MSRHIEPVSPVAVLTTRGVPFRLHEHSPALTVADLRSGTDFCIERSVKTLAFSTRDDRIVLAAVPGPAKVHYAALAVLVGVRRADLRPSTPEVLAGLGMEPGGISPIPTLSDHDGLVMVFDESVPSLGPIFCGSGSAHQTIEVGADALVGLWKEPLLGVITAPPNRTAP
ncbi:YbaK/EbsC family protein [Streptomyces sp. NPDC048106]|uniref:aminoacyl-tRNA deacylase n=1 Tax=Streptomyces sp. NPDC048106 TaxID=3155750 RepID=UPI0034549DED